MPDSQYHAAMASYQDFSLGERALHALMALSEFPGTEMAVSQAEIAAVMRVDPETARNGVRWLKARRIVDVDNSFRPARITIADRAAWVSSANEVSGENQPKQAVKSNQISGVIQPPKAVKSYRDKRCNSTANGAPTKEDHDRDLETNQPTTNHEIGSPGGDRLTRQVTRLSKKARDELEANLARVIAFVRAVIGRKQFTEMDRVHMRAINRALAKGISPDAIEEAVHGLVEARKIGGEDPRQQDQPWLVGLALKEARILDAAGQIEAAAPVPPPIAKIKIVVCEYCRDKIRAPEEEIDEEFRRHAEDWHPGMQVRKIGG